MPVKYLIQLRRGTAAAWTAANPVLMQGEEGHETDTGLRKMGDGVTAWNSLAYWPALNSRPGVPGQDGEDGQDGFPGLPGAAGIGTPGATGPVGPAGAFLVGADGEDGVDGFPGQPGVTGATGATGASGTGGGGQATMPGSDGEDGQDTMGMRSAGSSDPATFPQVTTGGMFIRQGVDVNTVLVVPAGYSFVVVGPYVVNGDLIGLGDMVVL